MKAPTEMLCLRCANISPLLAADSQVCQHCEWTVNTKDYTDLYFEARRILRFGHHYRQFYERQLTDDGKITTCACLVETPAWLIFIMTAALSGIIGNASYAAVKHVIKELYKKKPKRSDYGDENLSEDAAIDMLMKHSREFLDGKITADVEVQKLIQHEEETEIVSTATADALEEEGFTRMLESAESSEGSDEDKVKMQKVIEIALREGLRRIKDQGTSHMDRARMQELMSEVWNELPK